MSLFNANFFDLIVHALPEGSDSISRLALVAKKLGYSGIAIIEPVNMEHKIEDNNVYLPHDFSIHYGIGITCKSSQIRDEVSRNKGGSGLVVITGADEETNRAALETPGVDILLQPLQFNDVLSKIACYNSVAIGFDLSSLIFKHGEDRVDELIMMRTNLKHARKYNVPMILTGNSYSHYDLRSPREMAAISGLFGMTEKEAADAMSKVPLDMIRRKSPNYIQEGIEII
jgi:ribonuclease P/MRP protein subunit RPP1